MDAEEYDDLLRRLTTLIVKLDERLEQYEAGRQEYRSYLTIRLAAYDDQLHELRELHRQQVQINTRLETLMSRVFQDRHNGHEGDA